MSQYNASASISVDLTEDCPKHARVNIDGTVAGATDLDLGVARVNALNGEMVAVHALNLPGSLKMLASGSISKGDKVFTAADGKVSATQATGAFLRGLALEAAVDGDIVEVLNLAGEVAGS